MATKPPTPPPAKPPATPSTPGDKARSFILYAFALSIALHVFFGSFLNYKPYKSEEEKA